MIMANKCTGWGSISAFQHQNSKKTKQNSTTDASINFSRTTPPPKKKFHKKEKT